MSCLTQLYQWWSVCSSFVPSKQVYVSLYQVYELVWLPCNRWWSPCDSLVASDWVWLPYQYQITRCVWASPVPGGCVACWWPSESVLSWLCLQCLDWHPYLATVNSLTPGFSPPHNVEEFGLLHPEHPTLYNTKYFTWYCINKWLYYSFIPLLYVLQISKMLKVKQIESLLQYKHFSFKHLILVVKLEKKKKAIVFWWQFCHTLFLFFNLFNVMFLN